MGLIDLASTVFKTLVLAVFILEPVKCQQSPSDTPSKFRNSYNFKFTLDFTLVRSSTVTFEGLKPKIPHKNIELQNIFESSFPITKGKN